jgi:hypothetical protein
MCGCFVLYNSGKRDIIENIINAEGNFMCCVYLGFVVLSVIAVIIMHDFHVKCKSINSKKDLEKRLYISEAISNIFMGLYIPFIFFLYSLKVGIGIFLTSLFCIVLITVAMQIDVYDYKKQLLYWEENHEMNN